MKNEFLAALVETAALKAANKPYSELDDIPTGHQVLYSFNQDGSPEYISLEELITVLESKKPLSENQTSSNHPIYSRPLKFWATYPLSDLPIRFAVSQYYFSLNHSQLTFYPVYQTSHAPNRSQNPGLSAPHLHKCSPRLDQIVLA
jgi:hypothetical protein